MRRALLGRASKWPSPHRTGGMVPNRSLMRTHLLESIPTHAAGKFSPPLCTVRALHRHAHFSRTRIGKHTFCSGAATVHQDTSGSAVPLSTRNARNIHARTAERLLFDESHTSAGPGQCLTADVLPPFPTLMGQIFGQCAHQYFDRNPLQIDATYSKATLCAANVASSRSAFFICRRYKVVLDCNSTEPQSLRDCIGLCA